MTTLILILTLIFGMIFYLRHVVLNHTELKHTKYTQAILDAIGKSQAVVEFDMMGNILTANLKFLTMMEYTLPEIQGKHHKTFVEPSFRNNPDYQNFWNNLACGEYKNGEFKRITKSGREIWIHATYNPIINSKGIFYFKVWSSLSYQFLKNFLILSAKVKKDPDLGMNLF